MFVTKENNSLKIVFAYNPVIVNAVKKIDGRKFDSKEKCWTVPVIQVKKVIDILSKYKFQFNSEVINEYNNFLKKEKKIERVRQGKFKESEEQLFKEINLPLFDFQKIGAGFLSVTQSGLIGDEPGLGKSLQSLATIKIKKANKVLIFCPNILKLNWKEELEKWDNSTITVIDGNKKKREILWKENSKFFIVNYELILRDFEEINLIDWDYLVVDEATRVSNPKAKQSKLIKKIKSKYRIALTGTPFNNSIQDIWNIIDFCQPSLMGTYWEFLDKYCLLDHFRTVIGYKNLDLLKENIKTIMIRRLKSEILKELPDKVYENIYVDLSSEERKIYEAVKKELKEELKDLEINIANDKFLSNALVKIVRLMQVADSLELVSEKQQSTKIEVVKELLSDILHKNSKAIIYTRFEKMSKILERELKDYNPLLITGKVNKNTRNENIKNFKENDKNKILIMTESGTYGLNIQIARYVIHFDLPWSISKLEQREGRVHRIGQQSKVVVYKIIATNTIDEYILKTLYRKEKQSTELLSDKKRLSRVRITKRELKEMLE